MVDCGAGFAGEDMPGIDMIIPDINFVCKNCENFLGIVLTHAHEDHCGAIQYVWRKLECPVYASPFTAAVLRARFEEFNIPESTINEVDLNDKFQLGPFDLELISLTHSIPEMSAISITVDQDKGKDKKTIIHSGDWKFDHDPVVGEVSNEERLKQIGEDGVMAMICDSTNVFSEGSSGSEGDLHDSIYDLLSMQKGLVAITLFASNVARIATIAKVAKSLGREIAVMGRSLIRIITAAQESGYLEGINFLDAEDATNIPRDKLLLLCTGCQGDLLSATNKLANRSHKIFSLKEGDTVIFSSKIIPGNEKRISSMLNKFIKMGVNIITEKDHKVHVSGHPYRDELKKMYKLVKPKIAIPVHGEHMHIYEHANLATECGVLQSLKISDGDVIQFKDNIAKKIDKIDTSFLGIDGSILQSPNNIAISERRNMSEHGHLICILIINAHYELMKLPTILAPGLLENKKLLRKFAQEVNSAILSAASTDYRAMTNLARSTIRSMLKRTKKRPYITIQIEKVNDEYPLIDRKKY